MNGKPHRLRVARERMSRKSGNRFSDKDMRLSTNLERVLIPTERDTLKASEPAWPLR
jgi:hypothetical protein